MSKVRLAIISNVMVGHRCVDLLDKSDASLFDITCSVKNPVKPMTVSPVILLLSHHTAEELSLVRGRGLQKHGVKVLNLANAQYY